MNIWSRPPSGRNSQTFSDPTFTGTKVTAQAPIVVASPTTQTGASYTVAANDTYIIANVAGTQTLTLPAASSFTGRRLVVKTITANTVVSASSNVIPRAGGAAGTAILAAAAGNWAELVSNGTNWEIMAGS